MVEIDLLELNLQTGPRHFFLFIAYQYQSYLLSQTNAQKSKSTKERTFRWQVMEHSGPAISDDFVISTKEVFRDQIF
jgi:hypothetical protein